MNNNQIEVNNNYINSSTSDRNVLHNPNLNLDAPNIRVLIVDAQQSICQHLQLLLEPEAGLEVVGTATNGAVAINLIESLQPEIVLLDVEIPVMDGFETIEVIVKRFPGCKILVLSSSDNKDDIKKALKAGARGYLLKSTSIETIADSIRSAGKRHFQLSPGLFTKIFLPKLNGETKENTQTSESAKPEKSKQKDGSTAKKENKMFRQESLERLSSPERLDQLMRVVNPKSWIPLATLGVLGASALTWSIFGRIPVTIQGAGVLVYPSTVVPVQTKSSGQLIDLKVKNGELVEKGDVIATIDRSDRREELELALAQLAQLKKQNTEAEGVQDRRKNQDLQAIQEQRQTLEQRLQILEDLTPTLKDKGVSAIQRQRQNLQQRQQTLEELRPTFKQRLETRQMLFERGAISEDVLLEARQQYYDNISGIDEVEAQLKELDVQEADALQQYLSNLNEVKNVQAQIQELDSKKANLAQQDWENSTNRTKEIQEVERKIAQIQQEINSESQIVSQHSGKILELTVNQGQVVEAGTRLASIDTDNQEGKLVGVTYFPVKDGKKVQPGMEVQVTPQTIKRERFGGIVGTVTKVSSFPITTEAAANVVGNPQIIAGLVPETEPVVIQISAKLDLNPRTFSGYEWSSSEGPKLKISSGTTTSARVKVEERAPISFVFPILRSISGIY
ncbi:NHLP bacteriocin system secretion protein [Pleurocapsa sp. PCC 7319]|uniref:NHLP bacteriocin system secretion protein n=1 Tax=Pleurocapsa sp. PCC 7319 TaxID=118161 RepID=UPI00034D22C8|nr:NHLP bacteriocin system secretion protein [Pleurocapsa sp. PCC 7319]